MPSRELAWARVALEELIATLALPDTDVTVEARTRARARFARFTLPAAVIATDGIRMANDAWRVIAGATVPRWVEARLDVVRQTGAVVVLDGIPSADRAAPVTATLSRAHAGDEHAVLVVARASAAPTDNGRSSARLASEERDRLLLQVRLQDQVLAAVSHELRAPVTTITLWLRVLRDPLADQAARHQAIDAIEQSAAAQSRIVGDLLDVCRATSGKLHVDLRPVNVDTLVHGAVEAAGPAALAKQLALIHDADTFVGDVQGDAARLRQVLDNLLGNAIKFTPGGGQVRVRVRRVRLAVVIEVEDTGCGIERDALALIFEPFRQLEGAPDGGLGLGLAIALHIVELHHGTIEATSEGRGRGTRMTVTLPAVTHCHAKTLSDVRVLVVDDDIRVRDALTHLLERVGARVIHAESAAVARKRLISDSPHVLVCDIAMADEDGHAFIRSLRASGNNVPAIALTGHASRADAVTALSSGFNLHVAKPIDFESFVARIMQLLSSQIT